MKHIQKIESRIHEIRGIKVMLDFDLAELYEVETKVLNQAVKRNPKRFPDKFMFRLNEAEWDRMRSQIVTASDQRKRNVSALPIAFTEHGVTMLASVLKSDKAIQVNIAIVDAFITLRTFSSNVDAIISRLKKLELQYDKQFKDVFEALRYLLEKDQKQNDQRNRKRIGY
ncbi:MAG: ORF6N domain-containing protein [Bacteroidales bacterium]|nr:ORF6N domain-containing protein [Bacteroidales bacterium]